MTTCYTYNFYATLNALCSCKLFKAIRNALEREIGLINGSREAALESTDGSDSKRVLTKTGMLLSEKELT